jgi:RNA polymerase sigma factor (sigma-70 family)
MEKNEILARYYTLIKNMAESFQIKASPGLKRVMEVDDLFVEGVIGAISAIDSFNPEKGALTPWIRFKAYYRMVDVIRNVYSIPQKEWKKIEELMKSEEELIKKFGRDPTDEELADYMGVTVDTIEKIRSSIINTVDIDTYPIRDKKPLPDKLSEKRDILQYIHTCVRSSLTGEEGFVWVERNIYERTGKVVAEKIKLTIGQVYSIERRAKRKLNKYLRNEGFSKQVLLDIMN